MLEAFIVSVRPMPRTSRRESSTWPKVCMSTAGGQRKTKPVAIAKQRKTWCNRSCA